VRSVSPLAALCAVTAASWVTAWVVLSPEDAARAWVLDIESIVVPLVAALFSWRAGPMRSMRLLSVVCVLWTVGNAIWATDELFLDRNPFPSPADAFYLPAVVVLGAAFLYWPGVRARREREAYGTPALAAAVSLLVGYELLLAPLLPSGFESPTDALLVAYPVLDLLLLGAATALLVLPGTRQRGRLSLLVVGVGFLFVGDASYAETPLVHQWSEHLGSIGWDMSFLAVAAAARTSPEWGFRRLQLGDGAVSAGLGVAVAATVAHQAWQVSAHGVEPFDNVTVGALLIALVVQAWRTSFERGAQLERLARAQVELERAHALQEATMDASRTGNCVFDGDGRAAFWNPAFLELLGIEDHECHDWDWAAFVGYLQRVCRTQADGLIAAGAGGAIHFWTSGGRFLALRIEEIADGQLLVVADDLTAQEEESATRARFVAEIVGAQEREARRIGELLHDDAVQELTALALRLELAAIRSGDESLSALARDAGAVTSSLRTLLVQLHPAVLESQGLVPAIETAAAGLRDHGVAVEITPYAGRHSPETEQLVYRLVQEAFANALKHAGARSVAVQVYSDGRTLHCRISDDGAGFDVEQLDDAVRRGHLGLHLLRERVEIAGGSVQIVSNDGEGTSVQIAVPSTERALPLEEVA
jgi:signal transduction histidine kinase